MKLVKPLTLEWVCEASVRVLRRRRGASGQGDRSLGYFAA